MKLPVSLQIVLRALIEEGLKQPTNPDLLANVSRQSLHNNHHAYPRAAKFSLRRSECDPSWPIIRSLAAAGLLVIAGPPIAWSPVATGRRTP